LARDTVEQVREAIWVVQEANDNVGGLVTRITSMVSTLSRDLFQCRFEIPTDSRVLSRPVSMAIRQDLYSLVKEAVQNIIKHADASRVDIHISYVAPYLTIAIVDDGRGFELDTVERGLGLKSIRDRVERHRGSLQILSAPGQGTRLDAKVKIG